MDAGPWTASHSQGPLFGFRGRVVELFGARRLVVWIAGIGQGLFSTLADASVVRVGGVEGSFA